MSGYNPHPPWPLASPLLSHLEPPPLCLSLLSGPRSSVHSWPGALCSEVPAGHTGRRDPAASPPPSRPHPRQPGLHQVVPLSVSRTADRHAVTRRDPVELLAGRQPRDTGGDTGGQTRERKPLLPRTWGALVLTHCLVSAKPRGLSTCGLPGPWSSRLTGSSWAHEGFSRGAVP